MFEIVPKGFYYDFVARRHIWAGISLVTWLLAVIAIFVKEPNWSIDFTGGTEVQMHFQKDTTVEEVRGALATIGIGEDAVQSVECPQGNCFLFRVQGASSADPKDVEAVKAALTGAFGADFIEEFREDSQVGTRVSVLYKGEARPLPEVERALASLPGVLVQSSTEENTFYLRLPGVAEHVRATLQSSLGERGVEIDRTDTVGPKVGDSLKTAGIFSLLITMGLLFVYIGFRFDPAFAPGAILCLFHDSVMLIGIWVVTQQEFGLSMISALLTLLGYSINDTIVVYDRIRENMEKYRQKDFGKLINDSINQTLSRTIVTSGATLLSMMPFLFLGGPVLQQFAQAMIIGIVIGTYSSIYVAAPLTMVLEENREKIAGFFGLGKRTKAA